MPQIHYNEIGSLAWCDQYRDQLEGLMEKALTGDNGAEILVVNCAAHFYGLSIFDYENVAELIDTIKSFDQNLEFA